jgi:hypothetical protein
MKQKAVSQFVRTIISDILKIMPTPNFGENKKDN